MQPLGLVLVRDKDGVCGAVISPGPHSTSNASQVLVQLESGRQLLVPASALVQQPDGSYFLPLRLSELEHSGSGGGTDLDNPLVLPVIEEVVDVQKRVVETGKVRITKVVHERETLVDEPLWREEVEITRVPIQRIVNGPIPVRYEDDTMVISIVEEVLVVEKRLMLKEELHIRKQCRETHQPQQIILRSEEARVERLNAADKKEP
jgi:uncharacterized protein (TIGR02271 family)